MISTNERRTRALTARTGDDGRGQIIRDARNSQPATETELR